jgi:hypothetical protein
VILDCITNVGLWRARTGLAMRLGRGPIRIVAAQLGNPLRGMPSSPLACCGDSVPIQCRDNRLRSGTAGRRNSVNTEIIAFTFTDRGAGELKARIPARIEELLGPADRSGSVRCRCARSHRRSYPRAWRVRLRSSTERCAGLRQPCRTPGIRG